MLSVSKCYALWQVVDLSRTWYWTASEEDYQAGWRELCNRAQSVGSWAGNPELRLVYRGAVCPECGCSREYKPATAANTCGNCGDFVTIK